MSIDFSSQFLSLFLIHLSISLSVLFYDLFFEGFELMTVGYSQEFQLFPQQFIVIFDLNDIFSNVLDELDVIDLHEPLKDIIEDFLCGDGL